MQEYKFLMEHGRWMMKLIISILSKLIIYFVMFTVVRYVVQKASKEDIVCQNNIFIRKSAYVKFYWGASFIFMVIFAVVSSFPNETEKRAMYIFTFVMLSMILLCITIGAMYKRWYIKVEENKILYSNFLGKVEEIDLHLITNYKIGDHGELVFLRNEDDIFKIDSLQNRRELILLLKQKHIFEKKEKKINNFTIQPRTFDKVVCICVCLAFVFETILCLVTKYKIGIIFFSILELVSLIVCMQNFVEKIVFQEEHICQYRLMHRKKVFSYQDITNVKAQKKGYLEYYYFYSKNKILFKVSMSSCNANLLRELVDRKKWKNKSHN